MFFGITCTTVHGVTVLFQDAMEHSLAEHMNSLADLDARQRLDAVRVSIEIKLFIVADPNRSAESLCYFE